MDDRAKRALVVRIDEFLNGCNLTPTLLFDSNSWDKVASIAKQVVKAKGEWMDESDFYALVFLKFHDLLPDFSRLEGDLKSFIDPAVVSEAILSEVVGIPYLYNVYYEFPEIGVGEYIGADFDGGSSFRVQDSNFVKGVRRGLLGEVPNSRRFYYRVSLTGYISVSDDSATLLAAHGLLKVFLERSFSSMLLLKNAPSSVLNSDGVVFIHLIGGGGEVRKIVSLNLPRDLASVLGGVRTVGVMNGITQHEFDVKLLGFQKLLSSKSVQAKRLMVASQWCLDSDVEAAPAMSVVKVCIGLESIYGDETSEGGITRSLSDRCAYSLAADSNERDGLVADCRNLYKVRSKVVHGVRVRLSADERHLLLKGRKILERSITKEIDMI